jgi:putative endonuclease
MRRKAGKCCARKTARYDKLPSKPASQKIPVLATSTERPWFLYMIECEDGSIYTGIAVDVAARYAAHAAGKGARYTKSHPPRRLLATVPYLDRSEASKAEYAMKLLTAAEKRAFCAANPLSPDLFAAT